MVPNNNKESKITQYNKQTARRHCKRMITQIMPHIAQRLVFYAKDLGDYSTGVTSNRGAN